MTYLLERGKAFRREFAKAHPTHPELPFIDSRPAGLKATIARSQIVSLSEPRTPMVVVERDPAVSLNRLSTKAQEVLELLAQGLADKAIGRQLRKKRRTITSHMYRIHKVLGSKDKITTVIKAIQDGLLRLEDTVSGYDPITVLESELTRGEDGEERILKTMIAIALDNPTASDASVAKSLGISERTVSKHMSNIFYKLRVDDRLQAGLLYLRCLDTLDKEAGETDVVYMSPRQRILRLLETGLPETERTNRPKVVFSQDRLNSTRTGFSHGPQARR